MRRVTVLLAAGLAAAARAYAGASSPVVEDGKVVALEYTLRLEDGKLVDTNVGATPLVLVQGRGEGMVGPEHAIAGIAVRGTQGGGPAPAGAHRRGRGGGSGGSASSTSRSRASRKPTATRARRSSCSTRRASAGWCASTRCATTTSSST